MKKHTIFWNLEIGIYPVTDKMKNNYVSNGVYLVVLVVFGFGIFQVISR
jgi:hypothetical protein